MNISGSLLIGAVRGSEVIRDPYSVSDGLQYGLTECAKSLAEGDNLKKKPRARTVGQDGRTRRQGAPERLGRML